MKVLLSIVGSLMTFVAAAELPPLLRTQDGRMATSAATWEKVRRPEILGLFRTNVFGVRPVERPATLRFEEDGPATGAMDGRAIRRKIRIRYSGPGGDGVIDLLAFIPRAGHPVPAFVLIQNRNPQENMDAERRHKTGFWPAEEIVARGYAALVFQNNAVVPDDSGSHTQGVFRTFGPAPATRTKTSWGTISAWAWGASRVMDWIETEPALDARRVAIVGHSRGGKTALWTGATDPRFALVVSSCSGCGGAKLHRMDLPKSESIARITKTFPYWFCGAFSAYAGREAELPVDAHELLALIAPRLLYVSSATRDDWAGQPGEFRACQLASPAWELYGKQGLVGNVFPPPEHPLVEGSIGYHLRIGQHDLTAYDWARFMDFADARNVSRRP